MSTDLSGWRAKRVLVTGGTGFIGSRLLRRLAALDADVHATSRHRRTKDAPAVSWRVADLGDAEETTKILDAVRPDVVFHLSSIVTGSRDPKMVLPIMHANLTSVVNLLAALAESPTRVVLAGSVEETAMPDLSAIASSPYAMAKWAATAYARMYHQLWGLPVTVLRIAMTYGPDQPDQAKLVPYVIQSLLNGQQPKISRGERLVDWIYVDDVVDAFVAAGGSSGAAGEVVDIGSGHQVSVRETVELIYDIVGAGTVPSFGEVADRPLDRDQISDPAGAARLFGWRPRIGLEEGLRRTVTWYERHSDHA